MPTEKIKILSADTCEKNSAFLKNMLSQIPSSHFIITTAVSFEDARQALCKESFELVISCSQLLRELSKLDFDCPILLLSDDDTEIEFPQDKIADQISPKNLSIYSLQKSISYLLSHHESRKEHSQLRLQLKQVQKMESLGQLTSGIAHDFNNKLTVIQANVEVLKIAFLKGKSPVSCIDSIKRAVKQASGLSSRLLAFSHKQKVKVEKVQLNEVVEQSVNLLERIINKRIHLTFSPSDDLSPIEIDPVQVDQIIMNLVVNAQDAIQSSGNIHITTKNADSSKIDSLDARDYVCLSVKDDGPGIPDELREKIFEPFFTTKGVEKGTGLGLSVVHDIIAEHGGLIRLSEECDIGSCFEIFFKKVTATEKKEYQPPCISGSLHQQTVLFVEDDDELREMYSFVMEGHGFNVLRCKNGIDAEKLFTEKVNEIDYVLTDVAMPKMNGEELFHKLREKDETIPFIFITGHPKAELTYIEDKGSLVRFHKKPSSFKDILRSFTELHEERITAQNSTKKEAS